MREAVEERAGEPLGAEHGRPLVERQIARDQRAASLVALAEDLEQQLAIPIYSGHLFRREAGRRYDLMSATIPE